MNKLKDLIIEEATKNDLKDILKLQKKCFEENAKRYNDFQIPPLIQTLESIQAEFENLLFLKAVIDNIIVGSVRGYTKDRTSYINKLIVDSKYQNHGIGKKLMIEIEKKLGANHFELFTGYKDEKNIYLYKKLGYNIFTKEENKDPLLVFLHKLVEK